MPVKPILQGRLYRLNRQPYANLIWPLVQVKQLFQLAYSLLLGIMWDELTKRRSYTDTATSLLLLLIFGVLSLLSYYARDYDHWIFVLFGLLWWFDVGFAKQQYFAEQSYQQVAVKADEDDLEIAVRNQSQLLYQESFRRSQANYILIERVEVRGGAFKEALTHTWRGKIVLRDRSQYLVFEKRSVMTALKAARKLQRHLQDIPIIFACSQGLESKAAELLPISALAVQSAAVSTIHLRQQAQQWHLFSRWNLGSSGRMIKDALQQSGFLLFVVLTTKFMAVTGELLHQLLWQNTSIIYLPSLIGLSPEWWDWLEVAIAFGLVLWKGLEISQEEHLYIDAKQLTFCLNRRHIAQLNTAKIETLLYLRSPEPMLLIADRNQAIEITGLQTEAEFQALLLHLEKIIRPLQSGKIEADKKIPDQRNTV
ncbi:hypothetical protein [Sphaerothrix gracilis]|uniref:hypothetical protein n=1 Tax=Sphaerothrix gracilis TaxID=3151835 RepID=UPI0031FCB222